MALLGENENDGMTLVGKVSVMVFRFWTEVGFVGFIQSRHSIVGGLLIFVFGLVVEQSHLEMFFAGDFFEQSKIRV